MATSKPYKRSSYAVGIRRLFEEWYETPAGKRGDPPPDGGIGRRRADGVMTRLVIPAAVMAFGPDAAIEYVEARTALARRRLGKSPARPPSRNPSTDLPPARDRVRVRADEPYEQKRRKAGRNRAAEKEARAAARRAEILATRQRIEAADVAASKRASAAAVQKRKSNRKRKTPVPFGWLSAAIVKRLGSVPDAAIAKTVKRSRERVGQVRRSLGIPAYRRRS